MVPPTLTLGGVTHHSARLMVSNWRSSNIRIGACPPLPRNANVTVLDAPVLRGEARRLIVDIEGLAQDSLYVPGSPVLLRDSVTIRTAPASFSCGKTLLATASCYFPSEHFQGNPALVDGCLSVRAQRAGNACKRESWTPTAFFMTGDQIYADVPFNRKAGRLSSFGTKYRDAWSSSRLGPLLRTGGTFFVPDDHEYWNNYPESALWLPYSWRGRWQESGRNGMRAFWAYQGVWNFPPGFRGSMTPRDWWAQGLIGELPVFLSDTRVHRTAIDGKRCPAGANGGNLPGFVSPAQMEALVSWLDGLSNVGLLVVGQPLLHTGGWTDRAVADYDDQFEVLMAAVRAALMRGVNLVVLTGDVHWGRLSIIEAGPGRMIEFVSSPIARVARRSIFGTRWSRRKPKNTNWKSFDDHSGPVRRALRPSAVQRVFATGEHNFGILEIETLRCGRLGLTFELWDIGAERRAVNPWTGPGRPRVCTFRVIV